MTEPRMGKLNMAGKRKRRNEACFSVLLIALCAVSASVCILLYNHDNKYTVQGAYAIQGVLRVGESDLQAHPVLWLVRGWEYYGGKLLTPDDFTNDKPIPDKYMFIGQYAGFEGNDPAGNPHGSASYRLNIEIPGETRAYLLYLPEIYSSYRLYVNGTERLAVGEPEPSSYFHQTGEKTVFIEAAGNIEILIAASDFSNIYSGMVYPPAFGVPEAVGGMVNLRLIIRSIVLSVAMTIGIISLLIWLRGHKNSLWLLYALICLCFLGYAGYPVIHTVTQSFSPSYLLENLSFCMMIVFVMMLQRALCGIKNSAGLYAIAFGILVSATSVLFRIFLPYAGLVLMASYSNLIAVYKWSAALFITVTTVISILKEDESALASKGILCGVLVFDCALVMDRILPLYEPVLSGWFIELASAVLILVIGGVIAKEVHTQYVNNLILEENIRLTERQLSMQTEQYGMMAESIKKESALRHDLRHHISVMNQYAGSENLEALQKYLAELQSDVPADSVSQYCENPAVNAVVRYYAAKAEEAGVDIEVGIGIPKDFFVNDVDLCILFGNCLENAFEACKRQRSGDKFIRLKSKIKGSVFTVTIDNSFDGILQTDSGTFLSRKRAGAGIGLSSVDATAKKYGGYAVFEAFNMEFHASVILYSALRQL